MKSAFYVHKLHPVYILSVHFKSFLGGELAEADHTGVCFPGIEKTTCYNSKTLRKCFINTSNIIIFLIG